METDGLLEALKIAQDALKRIVVNHGDSRCGWCEDTSDRIATEALEQLTQLGVDDVV